MSEPSEGKDPKDSSLTGLAKPAGGTDTSHESPKLARDQVLQLSHAKLVTLLQAQNNDMSPEQAQNIANFILNSGRLSGSQKDLIEFYIRQLIEA